MITYHLSPKHDIDSLKCLLYQLDKTFPIPLSKKTDLDVLANKFLEKGYVYIALDGMNPVGMVGFYANDFKQYRAYISVVGVLPNYQGQGIAKQMMIGTLAICKKNGMTSCNLYTHKTNVGAIAMYKKLDFVAEEDAERPHDIKFTKGL